MKEIFSSCLCQEIDLKEQVKGVYLFISMKMCNLIDYLSGARCISATQAPERIDSSILIESVQSSTIIVDIFILGKALNLADLSLLKFNIPPCIQYKSRE